MSLDDDCLLISLVFFFSLSLFHVTTMHTPSLVDGRPDGWMDGWMDGYFTCPLLDRRSM